MGMRKLLSLFMMLTLVLVSGTAVAAAACRHQSAQGHAAALAEGEAHEAVGARLEESAAASLAKQGLAGDGGSFALPLFVIPSALPGAERIVVRSGHLRSGDADKPVPTALPPPLKPPAA